MSWQADFQVLRKTQYAGIGGLAAIAQALGVSSEAVRSWNQGRREPNFENQRKLAELATGTEEATREA